MSPGAITALVVLPVVLAVVYVWYRRTTSTAELAETPPISGVRLTAEALHRVVTQPWRVVYEITALGAIDHVIIGPPGVIAITTVVADRPSASIAPTDVAQLTADAAIQRGPIDELARHSGASCRLTARIFWGSPDVARPAFDEIVHASQLVEGQRLAEWLAALETADDRISAAEIDLAWRAVVMGIGRPDPLA